MPARSIITWPSAILAQTSEFISLIDSDVVDLANDLVDTMNVSFGAGLAATQVGDLKSMVVIREGYAGLELPPDPVVKTAVVLVNPAVKFVGDDKFWWNEACLSVPNYQGKVRRHKKIDLTYTDLSGKEHVVTLEDEPAGVVQHEVDHLNGKLFLDRLPSDRRRAVLMGLRRRINAEKKSKDKFLKMMSIEEERQSTDTLKIGRPRSKRNSKKKGKTYGKNKRRSR